MRLLLLFLIGWLKNDHFSVFLSAVAAWPKVTKWPSDMMVCSNGVWLYLQTHRSCVPTRSPPPTIPHFTQGQAGRRPTHADNPGGRWVSSMLRSASGVLNGSCCGSSLCWFNVKATERVGGTLLNNVFFYCREQRLKNTGGLPVSRAWSELWRIHWRKRPFVWFYLNSIFKTSTKTSAALSDSLSSVAGKIVATPQFQLFGDFSFH